MERAAWVVFIAVSAGVTVVVPHAAAQCDPVEVQKLLGDGGVAGEGFGLDVSVSGDYAVIGTNWGTGAAYVFERVDGDWVQVARLVPDDGDDDQFGEAVSILADIVAVGARGAGVGGAVYVYERIAGAWTQTAKLTPDDVAPGDWFGDPVCVGDQSIVGGAFGNDDNGDRSGSAYVFEKVSGDWVQTQKLLPDDGTAEDWFGRGIAMSGDLAMIGATGQDAGGRDWGAVYVFERSGGIWTQSGKLVPANGRTGNRFGQDIALTESLAVVGSPWDDTGGQDLGSAQVFERVGDSWAETQTLRPDDGVSDDEFGTSIATNGEVILVGSADADNFAGAVYLFERHGGEWVQAGKLEPPGLDESDKFYQVSLSGGTAVIGALGDENDDGAASGAAYVFDITCGCRADFNGDGVVDTRDFVAFLNAWAAGDMSADFDGNGVIDTRDFIAYLNLWAAGC